MTRPARPRLLTTVFLAAAGGAVARADAPPAGDGRAATAAIDKGLAFLRSKQLPDGGWAAASDPPAITALVLKALVQSPAAPADRAVTDKGFAALLALQKPDGGIYRDLLANYNTAISVTALAAAGDAYKPQVDKAVAYLRSLQWTDSIDQVPSAQRKPVPKTDPRYGGFGYGAATGTGRPDGSNVQMALDALHDAGVKPGDPAYAAAVAFETGCRTAASPTTSPGPATTAASSTPTPTAAAPTAASTPAPTASRTSAATGR